MEIAQFLGYLSAALSAALGVWGILHDFKTKQGRVTGAGQIAILGLLAAAILSAGTKYMSDQANLRRAEDARLRETSLRQDLQQSAARQAEMATTLEALSDDLESSRARESALLEDLEEARRDVARAASGSFFLNAMIKVVPGGNSETILGKGTPEPASPITCREWKTKACQHFSYADDTDCWGDPDKFHNCDFIDRDGKGPPHPAYRLNRQAKEWQQLFSGFPEFPAFGVYVVEPDRLYPQDRLVEIYACDLGLDVLTLDTGSPDFDTGAPGMFEPRFTRAAFDCRTERQMIPNRTAPSRQKWRAGRWLIKNDTSEVARDSQRDLLERRGDSENTFAIVTDDGVQSFHATLPFSTFGAIDQLAGKIVIFHTIHGLRSRVWARDPGVPFESDVAETAQGTWPETPRMIVQLRDGDGAFSPEYGILSRRGRASRFQKAGYRVVRLASEYEAATLIQFPDSRDAIRRCLKRNRC
ncbi:MAG: hypothetical protein AAFV19_23705 [Pseudomonadota bacterium]